MMRPYFRSTWRDLEAASSTDRDGVVAELRIRCARGGSRGARKLLERLEGRAPACGPGNGSRGRSRPSKLSSKRAAAKGYGQQFSHARLEPEGEPPF